MILKFQKYIQSEILWKVSFGVTLIKVVEEFCFLKLDVSKIRAGSGMKFFGSLTRLLYGDCGFGGQNALLFHRFLHKRDASQSTKRNELISHAAAFLEIRIMMTKQIMAAKVFIEPSKVSRTQR